MIAPAGSKNESERLRELVETELLDSPTDKEFDDIVRLASEICNAPISLITLVDSTRSWAKSSFGLPNATSSRNTSFCGHVILQDHLFEIQDTLKDERFWDNPNVTDGLKVRFYAGYPLITASGHRIGSICVIDTEPKSLNETQKFALGVLSDNIIKIAELRIKNKRLNHMAETQKKMTSILAHDVRSPLVSLRSIIEYKRLGMIDEDESEQLLEVALEQLNNTVEMVDDIVDWGESQLKFVGVTKEVVSLREITENIFGYEALKARLKNNKMQNQVNGTQLYTDKHALTFIIRNLVSNANKFTENGIISVSATQKNNHVYISIKDTGTGMDASVASKLFSSKTVSMTGTRNEKGNGLGLLLINEYIRKLEGSITVESEAGKGSAFTIRLKAR
ncbi:MAG: GAF domain-containing sensor histidine kinase [Bacteroidetes bacterium]|nr:GAF domain-containing sensor histidine kinase [Bacteroidota bacterium]